MKKLILRYVAWLLPFCFALVAHGKETPPPGLGASTSSIAEQQQANRTALEEAKAWLALLENGTLVVRLSTGTNKAKALQKMIDSPNTGEKDRSSYVKMLEKSRQAVKSQNQWLIAALRSKYSFSKLLFLPDTAATQLKNGVRNGIFVNDNLELDPTLKLEGGFLVGFYGTSQSDINTNNEGISIIDPQLKPMPYHFPAFVGRTSIRRIFEALFNKSTEKEHFEKLVSKFQKWLE